MYQPSINRKIAIRAFALVVNLHRSTERKSNRTTVGMRGTLPSKEHASKGVCIETRRSGGKKPAVPMIKGRVAGLDFGGKSDERAGTRAPRGEPEAGGANIVCLAAHAVEFP